MALPEIMVCDSLAVCQCFRTWIAFEVRMSRLVACVFGSTRRKQISGELSPRSGIILSHLSSAKFLKIGPSLAADVGSIVCAPMLANARNASARRIERANLVFMIGSIDPTFRFDKKSYATVAGIGDAGGSCLGVQRIDELDNESVRKTE